VMRHVYTQIATKVMRHVYSQTAAYVMRHVDTQTAKQSASRHVSSPM
jgi:hypothetical protein